MEIPKTIFCDIDGVLIRHGGKIHTINDNAKYNRMTILPGVLEKLSNWKDKCYQIILVTARPESMRRLTKYELQGQNIVYDQLIMGVSRGQRVVINDFKPDMPEYHTAFAVNLKRDEGLINVEI